MAKKAAPKKQAPKAKGKGGKPNAGNPHQGDVRMEGKTSGMYLTQYVSELLEKNRKSHLSDIQLAAALAKEFPGRHLQKISAYRSYHNAGKHGHGVGDPPTAPKAPVVAYREDGTPRNAPQAKPATDAGKAKPAKGKAKSVPAKRKPAIA